MPDRMEPAGRARPVRWSPELGRVICARLAGGTPEAALCREPGMPSVQAVRQWAVREPEFGAAAVKRFGSKTIVVAIDADRTAKLPSRREVVIDGGRTKTGLDAVEFAKRMADLGVGEILPTSKMGDGT